MNGKILFDAKGFEGQHLFAGTYRRSDAEPLREFDIIISPDGKSMIVSIKGFPPVQFPSWGVPMEAEDLLSKEMGRRSFNLTLSKYHADMVEKAEKEKLEASRIDSPQGQKGETNADVSTSGEDAGERK